MKTRREFVKLSALGVLSAGSLRAALSDPSGDASALPAASGAEDRAYWCQLASRLATPVLTALQKRQLKATMPVEAAPRTKDRALYTYLEALGRLLCGLAPWLELGADETAEGQQRASFGALAREAIDAASDPRSPDFMNFAQGRQPLVDAAFLAQAMLRAPQALWAKLEPRVKSNVIAALKSSRPIPPGESNWKLFASEIEAFLHQVGEPHDPARLAEALDSFKNWYVGDGYYGDGPEFHWDYYNAFVIHPMLLETLDVFAGQQPTWQAFHAQVRERLSRFAQIEERLISPDGSYPVIGRSIAYRCGAFQGLALASWRKMLPAEVAPAQARVALTSVIRKTLEAPGTWDANGWLRIGVCGHQPSIGETYISTGSLYLCSAAFPPLGLAARDPFWSDPREKTTWEKIWSGQNLPADHAIKSPKSVA